MSAHLDSIDRDSDDDILDSVSYEDACEGPHTAEDELNVRYCGFIDPSINRASVVARGNKTRSYDEHSVTLREVMEELDKVKGALRGLVLRLEDAESYVPGARKGQTRREPAVVGHSKSVAKGDRDAWRTASCGCSWRAVVASAALVAVAWRYAMASNSDTRQKSALTSVTTRL